MLTKLKSYLGIALVALAGIAAGLVAILRNQRDKAVAERETAETQRDQAVEVNKHNEQIKEVRDAIDEKRDEVSILSNDDVVSRMHKYDRARSNKD